MISNDIFNQDGTICEYPDLDKGRIEHEEIPVSVSYVLTKGEIGHYEIVRVYPETGGADVEWVVDEEEVGSWKVSSAVGEIDIASVDLNTDALDKTMTYDDVLIKQVYVSMTEEEMRATELAKKQEEEREAFITEAPEKLKGIDLRLDSIQAEQDAAICGLYEQSLVMQAESDQAITELYEMLLEVTNG